MKAVEPILDLSLDPPLGRGISMERSKWAIATLFLILMLSPSLINLAVGLGENIDSYLMWRGGTAFLESTFFGRSRSWGYPLYEFVAYRLLAFGPLTAKFYSLFWSACGSLFAYRLLRWEGLAPKPAWLGALAFAWMPCTIISGNTLLETSQSTALGLLTLLTTRRYFTTRVTKDLLIAFLFCAVAMGTRPCHFISFASLVLVAALFRMVSLPRLALYSSLTFFLAMIPYLTLYHSMPWFQGISIIHTGDPLAIKAVKTAIGYAAVIGLPAWLVLIAFASKRAPLLLPRKTAFTPWNCFFVIFTALYLFRLFFLPDEIEYFHVWGAALILFAAARMNSIRWQYALIIAVALPNLVQFHIFDRAPDGAVVVSPGVSPGAILQDRDGRLLKEFTRTEYLALAQKEWNQEGCQGVSTVEPIQIFSESFPIAEGPTCVFTSLKWYARIRDQVFPDQKLSMESFLAQYPRTVIMHQIPTDRGWRRFLRYEEVYPLSPEQLRFNVKKVGMSLVGHPQRSLWLGAGN
jgi:hypothetical protein